MCVRVCVRVVCVCACMHACVGRCLFHSEAKSDPCSKTGLNCASHFVSFGACLSTVSANQKFSLCSGKHPFLQPRRGSEGRTPHLWFSPWESCCVLSPPGRDLYRNKVRLLYSCLPSSLGALEPQPCVVYQLFSLLIVKENQNIKTYALRNRRNGIVFRPPSPCLCLGCS